MDNFEKALLALNSADQENVLSRMHDLYSSISNMNANEVVVARQVIESYATLKKIEGNSLINELRKVTRTHMFYLWRSVPSYNNEGKEVLRRRFNSAAGFAFIEADD